jgi:hypothetical protein
MRFVAAIALAALATPSVAQAWDGNEGQLIGIIAGSMLVGNCDPIKKIMGDDSYLQGHHERCLGVVAFKASLEAEKKGDTEKATAQKQSFCDHYKRAHELWLQKPLPTHGTEEDAKRRQTMFDEVISTREKHCKAPTALPTPAE